MIGKMLFAFLAIAMIEFGSAVGIGTGLSLDGTGLGLGGFGHGGARSVIVRSRNDLGGNRLTGYIISPETGDFKTRNAVRDALGGGIDNIVSTDPQVGTITRLTSSSPILGGTRQVIIRPSLIGRYEQSPYYTVIPSKGGLGAGFLG